VLVLGITYNPNEIAIVVAFTFLIAGIIRWIKVLVFQLRL